MVSTLGTCGDVLPVLRDIVAQGFLGRGRWGEACCRKGGPQMSHGQCLERWASLTRVRIEKNRRVQRAAALVSWAFEVSQVRWAIAVSREVETDPPDPTSAL